MPRDRKRPPCRLFVVPYSNAQLSFPLGQDIFFLICEAKKKSNKIWKEMLFVGGKIKPAIAAHVGIISGKEKRLAQRWNWVLLSSGLYCTKKPLTGISPGPPRGPLWKCKLYLFSPRVRGSCIVWKQLEAFFHLDQTTSDTQAVVGGGKEEPRSWSSTVNYLSVKELKRIKLNTLGASKGGHWWNREALRGLKVARKKSLGALENMLSLLMLFQDPAGI